MYVSASNAYIGWFVAGNNSGHPYLYESLDAGNSWKNIAIRTPRQDTVNYVPNFTYLQSNNGAGSPSLLIQEQNSQASTNNLIVNASSKPENSIPFMVLKANQQPETSEMTSSAQIPNTPYVIFGERQGDTTNIFIGKLSNRKLSNGKSIRQLQETTSSPFKQIPGYDGAADIKIIRTDQGMEYAFINSPINNELYIASISQGGVPTLTFNAQPWGNKQDAPTNVEQDSSLLHHGLVIYQDKTTKTWYIVRLAMLKDPQNPYALFVGEIKTPDTISGTCNPDTASGICISHNDNPSLEGKHINNISLSTDATMVADYIVVSTQQSSEKQQGGVNFYRLYPSSVEPYTLMFIDSYGLPADTNTSFVTDAIVPGGNTGTILIATNNGVYQADYNNNDLDQNGQPTGAVSVVGGTLKPLNFKSTLTKKS